MAHDHYPAFPLRAQLNEDVYAYNEGMDLRDYFAGQALIILGPRTILQGAADLANLADLAYRAADALMEARKK